MHINRLIRAALAISVLAPWPASASSLYRMGHDQALNMKHACRLAVKAMDLHGDAFRAEVGKCRSNPKAYNIEF